MTTPALTDVHAHFVPGWYAEEAIAHGHTAPDGMPFWPEWDAEGHLRFMDENAIERSVLSLSSPGVHFGDDAAACELARRVNDFAAATCAAHPDRFSFFATLPMPAVGPSIDELRRCLDDLGAVGACLLTNAGGTYVTDPSSEPLWAELSRREVVTLLHPTSPPSWESVAPLLPRPMLEFGFETTRTVIGLLMAGTLDRHPGARLVVPHCGAALPTLIDRALVFQQGLRLLLPDGHPARDASDVDAGLRGLWFDTAGTPAPTGLRHLLDKVDEDRVVFGSDFCFTPPHAVSAQIAALDGSSHTGWRALVGANTARLLAHGQ